MVCTGRLGDLLRAAEQQSVEHLIVVSSAGEPPCKHSLATWVTPACLISCMPHCVLQQYSMSSGAALSCVMKSTMSSVIAMQTIPSIQACWHGMHNEAAVIALRSGPCLTCLGRSAGLSAGGFSLDAFMDAEASAQRSRSREEAVSSCSVPHTLVQIGRIRDVPGGQQAIAISQVDFPSSKLISLLSVVNWHAGPPLIMTGIQALHF